MRMAARMRTQHQNHEVSEAHETGGRRSPLLGQRRCTRQRVGSKNMAVFGVAIGCSPDGAVGSGAAIVCPAGPSAVHNNDWARNSDVGRGFGGGRHWGPEEVDVDGEELGRSFRR